MNKFVISILVSLFLIFSSFSYAGIKSKVAAYIGVKLLVKAAKSPKIQSEIIAKVTANPSLKKKVVENLEKIILNPKHANIKNESTSFLTKIKDIKDIKIANKSNIKPQSTAPPGVATINGKAPINSKLAGQTLPNGVKYNSKGFPDFSPHAKDTVKINMKGNRTTDFKEANRKAGYDKTPEGYTWHHHEDMTTMQLVPKNIHNTTPHSGGVWGIKNGGKYD